MSEKLLKLLNYNTRHTHYFIPNGYVLRLWCSTALQDSTSGALFENQQKYSAEATGFTTSAFYNLCKIFSSVADPKTIKTNDVKAV